MLLFYRSTFFGFSNARGRDDKELLHALFWTTWAGEALRQRNRQKKVSASLNQRSLAESSATNLALPLDLEEAPLPTLKRPNNANLAEPRLIKAHPWETRQTLSKRVNMVEVFAGAGGMALGFLQAQASDKELQLLFSGEIEPVYARTLRDNHRSWKEINGCATLPANVEPTNLADEESFERIAEVTHAKGEVSIVMGGPPCQGFSAANRNSWSSDNPNNRLVEVFFRHVEKMQPRVF